MEYGAILQVPEMTIWKLQAIEPPPGSLGELEGAPHIFAAGGFAGSPVYWLTSTDPAFAYLIRSSGFSDNAHIFNDELEAFLADRPHTIVWRNATLGNSVPRESPDGQYYIKEWYFDDPTANMWQESSAVFDAMTDEVVAYGYKNAWFATPLGWASDGSGAYFLFHPISPTGDALYDKYPIYKILVPGAEKQGLPVPVIITPASSSQHTLPDAAVAWQETDKGVLSHSSAQVSYSGWYIDDVSAIATDPPTPTPTATATPSLTPTATTTPDPSYATCEYKGAGGTVVVEAEHYSSQTAGTGNAQWSSWVDTTHVPGYGGSRAVWAFPDNRVGTGSNNNGPALHYAVQLDVAGSYYLYVRAWGPPPDGSGNYNTAVHAGLMVSCSPPRAASTTSIPRAATTGGGGTAPCR
ncbi:MAG: hypothetical protein HUU01_10805 [Saprospiraceae bacterium]|nr:hypothetical protein [Saprospiraceae bacterium]